MTDSSHTRQKDYRLRRIHRTIPEKKSGNPKKYEERMPDDREEMCEEMDVEKMDEGGDDLYREEEDCVE
jgi:hypothetical protein